MNLIIQAARIGAAGIYHAACHAYVFDGAEGENILKSLFKGAFFVLQALWFARTGEYPRTKTRLEPLLEGDDARVLQLGREWDAIGYGNDRDARTLVDLLLRWSENILLLDGNVGRDDAVGIKPPISASSAPTPSDCARTNPTTGD